MLTRCTKKKDEKHGFKLQQRKFKADIRKDFPTIRILGQLPRDVAASSSIKIIRIPISCWFCLRNLAFIGTGVGPCWELIPTICSDNIELM